MPALSKQGGGEEDRERPECVHSSAIQTSLKPTGAGALSPQLCFSLVVPLLPPQNLFHCKSDALFPISTSHSFCPLSLTFTLSTRALLSGTQTPREVGLKAEGCSCHNDSCVLRGPTQQQPSKHLLPCLTEGLKEAAAWLQLIRLTMRRTLKSVFSRVNSFHEPDTVTRSYHSNERLIHATLYEVIHHSNCVVFL